MIEEDGQEWYGYGFMSETSDPNAVEQRFMENVAYLEHYCRSHGLERKGMTLAKRISALFERLPRECDPHLTDNREKLIRTIVDFRNRNAHGKYDVPRPSIDRILVLSIKIAALLYLNEVLDESGSAAAASRSAMGSPYLRKALASSDS